MKELKRRVFVGLLLTISVFAEAASVPQLINYQGRLTDANGNALSNGAKKLTFNIYNTAQGGISNWGPQIFLTVPVMDGYFNVILGSTDANGKSIMEAFESDSAFLEITVDGGNPISPRQQILSTPYAINADMLGGGVVSIKNGVPTINGLDDNALRLYGAGSGYALLGFDQNDGYLKLTAYDPENGGWKNTQLGLGTGKVGIGTKSPSAKLDINGDLKVSGKLHLNIWTSPVYVAKNETKIINLGSKSFCALSSIEIVQRHTEVANQCTVWMDSVTSWKLKIFASPHGESSCQVLCFN